MDERYNVGMSVGMANHYSGVIGEEDSLSVVDKFAMAALPAVVALYGQNQPFVIAEECYKIAHAMAAQRKLQP
jgi:hypothetical protein